MAIYAGGIVASLIIYNATWLGASMLFSGHISTLFSPGYAITLATTTETVGALRFSNYWPMLDIVLGSIGIYILWRRGKGWQRYAVVLWVFVMAAATLWQVRFDYYLIVPVAILTGFAGSELWGNETKNTY